MPGEYGRRGAGPGDVRPPGGRAGVLGDDELLYEAAVGRAWRTHYRAAFVRLHDPRAGGWRWNWEAALVPLWLDFRQIPGWVLLYLLLLFVSFSIGSAVGTAIDLNGGLLGVAMLLVLATLAEGYAGDWLVYTSVLRAVERAKQKEPDPDAVLRALIKRAPSSGAGALLLRMLGGLATVWFLAFIVLSGEGINRQARLNEMKALLREVQAAQQAYRDGHDGYAGSIEELAGDVRAKAQRAGLTLVAEPVDSTVRLIVTDPKLSRRCILELGTPRADGEPASPYPLCGRPKGSGALDQRD